MTRIAALATLVVCACSAPGRPFSGGGADAPVASPGGADAAAAPVAPASGAHPAYLAAPEGPSGVVLGLITLARPAPRVAVAPVPGPSACPGSIAAPVLELAPSGGVIGAVVWLDDIARGKPLPGADAPAAELAFDGCVLRPRAVLVPGPGGKLAVRNEDPVRHVATLRFRGVAWLDSQGEGERTLAEWPMPLVGQRFEIALDRPGIVEVEGEPAPAAHALAIVPRHPYFAITDADGRYRLSGVPPGRYQVRAWHPPIDGAHELWALGNAEVVANGAAEVNLPLQTP